MNMYQSTIRKSWWGETTNCVSPKLLQNVRITPKVFKCSPYIKHLYKYILSYFIKQEYMFSLKTY